MARSIVDVLGCVLKSTESKTQVLKISYFSKRKLRAKVRNAFLAVQRAFIYPRTVDFAGTVSCRMHLDEKLLTSDEETVD